MPDRPTTTYFDHASTSWPKPPEVLAAVQRTFLEAGGNPGRGAHGLALAAARTISRARSVLSALLGVPEPRRLIFTPSCTYALNLALKGLIRKGDRVVASSVEHNAVARPLGMLSALGAKVVVARADAEGRVDPDEVERLVASAPTAAVVCQHASNVTGTIQAVGDLADVAHAHGSRLIVDGAQCGGHVPLDLAAIGADAYALAGHKGLLGPQGVGLLYLADGLQPDELVQGGSGGGAADPFGEQHLPERYEVGTPNTPGIAGLGAAGRFLMHHGDDLRAEERRLVTHLHDGLLDVPGLRILGPPPQEDRVPLLTVVHETIPSDELAFLLDAEHGIAVRAGLHCSPWTHETLGTSGTGATRFSLGYGISDEDVDRVIDSMRRICA